MAIVKLPIYAKFVKINYIDVVWWILDEYRVNKVMLVEISLQDKVTRNMSTKNSFKFKLALTLGNIYRLCVLQLDFQILTSIRHEYL